MTLHDQLKELAEKATPGPWEFVETEHGVSYSAEYGLLDKDGHPAHVSAVLAADAKLIAFLKINLPAILSALKNDQRYRWIRKQISDDMQWYLLDKTVSAPEEFDAAIDAAQSQEER